MINRTGPSRPTVLGPLGHLVLAEVTCTAVGVNGPALGPLGHLVLAEVTYTAVGVNGQLGAVVMPPAGSQTAAGACAGGIPSKGIAS